jgi:hypothetical protein
MGLYDKNLFKGRNDIEALRKQGLTDYNYGQGLLDEGLGGLRGLRGTYAQRVNDPLGEVGRGIFARARGNLTDAATRTVNAGGARSRQLALQTGGSLTPEQIAALDQETRRDANEQQFRGETDLSISEGTMALSEANRFFDRMEGIDRTIGAVGSDEKARGVQSILANLGFRSQKDAQKRAILGSFASALVGGVAQGASNSGYYGTAAGGTTSQNPWGIK